MPFCASDVPEVYPDGWTGLPASSFGHKLHGVCFFLFAAGEVQLRGRNALGEVESSGQGPVHVQAAALRNVRLLPGQSIAYSSKIRTSQVGL